MLARQDFVRLMLGAFAASLLTYPLSFKYAAVDSYGAVGVPATVSIQIMPVNDAPIALPGARKRTCAR